MDAGNITGIDTARATDASTPEKRALKQACKEFEGLLLGIIMKDSLKTEPLDDGDAAPAGDIFQEFASEQTARDMGQKEAFGIAKMMYEQLSGEKHNGH